MELGRPYLLTYLLKSLLINKKRKSDKFIKEAKGVS